MEETNRIEIEKIEKAKEILKGIIKRTPLEQFNNFNKAYNATIHFKREDLQIVRSYKIRGAYNKIKNLQPADFNNGIVCASAGNHAQGVAFACEHLKVQGIIFMPTTTPQQKIMQVEMFGKSYVEIKLIGDTFDDSYLAAMGYCTDNKSTFVHPFNDELVMAGQGTVGLEILEEHQEQPIDYLFLPVGGGGLASGVGSVFNKLSPNTKIIGVEPSGAPSLTYSLQQGTNAKLDSIDKFVDGAAVKQMGYLSFLYCKDLIDEVKLIDEGLICSTILKVYNENAMVVEPAGALSIAALELYKEDIKGKNVVCIVSGGNNDITRMEEMKERALMYEGLKHYFLVKFPQRAGALKEFVVDVLGSNDDITHFEFTKKHSRSTATAVVGIQLLNKKDFPILINNMKGKGFFGEYLNDNKELYRFLI